MSHPASCSWEGVGVEDCNKDRKGDLNKQSPAHKVLSRRRNLKKRKRKERDTRVKNKMNKNRNKKIEEEKNRLREIDKRIEPERGIEKDRTRQREDRRKKERKKERKVFVLIE